MSTCRDISKSSTFKKFNYIWVELSDNRKVQLWSWTIWLSESSTYILYDFMTLWHTIYGLNFLIIKLFNQSSLVELHDYQKVQLYKFNMLLYYICNKKWTNPVVVPEGHNTTYLPWNLRCFCNSFNTIQATLFPIGIASSSSELVKLFKGWTLWYILVIHTVLIQSKQLYFQLVSPVHLQSWSNFLKVEPSDTSHYQKVQPRYGQTF